MGAIQLHVPGALKILYALGTASSTLVGYTEDGVSLSIDMGWQDVYSDIYGPVVPVDTQFFLQQAIISFDLVQYDDDQLVKWMTQINGGTVGGMTSAGKLFHQNTLYFRLILSPQNGGAGWAGANQCFNFIRALPVSIEQHLGSKRKVAHCVWRALPYDAGITGGDSSVAVLYTTACS